MVLYSFVWRAVKLPHSASSHFNYCDLCLKAGTDWLSGVATEGGGLLYILGAEQRDSLREGFHKTSQELRMLSSVTINCQVTKIVMNSGSQLSEL